MTLYGYARVSVRELEDKNVDLQVERLVRAGCPLGNVRAEEASGAKNDRGGLLERFRLLVGYRELHVEILKLKWESSNSHTLQANGTPQTAPREPEKANAVP